ncbi:hypothetical protein [Psychrobacter sp. SZ93C1]|uniref:hypothetical protein n=1 Tax=Psychrobacter sp. SZ93C1 TaxID=2792058 RepID=UPI0018CCBE0B|nr:hypothetical protein [Psychrobacter sp. SZ93C1]MBH0065477.1 hypothetical protein [Psychrobacter sp. SZ93C1]
MELSTQAVQSMSKVALKTFNHLQTAHMKRQKKRLGEFVQCIETRYEVMSCEDKQKLNKFIESEEGESLLADYADSILKVSSNRVMMAMALLFCKGTDLSDVEESNFIKASKNLDDDLINFYMLAHKRKSIERDNIPYSRCTVSSVDCEDFTSKGWDKETIAVYVYELIRMRLLLPDPSSHGSYAGADNSWSIHYGISTRTQKIVNLLVKSQALLTDSKS